MGAQTADYALTGQARGSRMKLQGVVNAAALAVQIGCVAALAVLIGFECAAWANGPMGGTAAPAGAGGGTRSRHGVRAGDPALVGTRARRTLARHQIAQTGRVRARPGQR